MHGSNTKTTKAGEGFGLYSKPQEVGTRTISEVRLTGLPFFIRFGSCEAHARQAKTTTEQPISCQPNIPQPPRLVSRSSALQEHGFTAEVAERIAAPQRLSTRLIYTSKWTLFQCWCTEKQVDSIGDICNFFWYLFNDLNRCPSTIEGYRTAIADTLGYTKQNISTNPQIASFHRDKPKSSRPIPKWNLSLILQRLPQPPFEPQEKAALKFLTWKTVFLLALASRKRWSEIHA